MLATTTAAKTGTRMSRGVFLPRSDSTSMSAGVLCDLSLCGLMMLITETRAKCRGTPVRFPVEEGAQRGQMK